jgi:glucose-6-phosphate 1-dehydrogenase
MSQAYLSEGLSITVLGASGDLAKKKTFPALLDLFAHDLLPKHVVIVGYARSAWTDEELRAMVTTAVTGKGKISAEVIAAFVERIYFSRGNYDSASDFALLSARLAELELASIDSPVRNRMFYFAVPPNVFIPAAASIKSSAASTLGWNRLIVEKPFGHDYDSALEMSNQLTALWAEESIYRIDHYLGKEMVQNIMLFRFGNTFLEPLLNRNHVAAVQITFKEDFGTMGRGGYFDNYGIIRDIMQNHLMQVLSLVAMEPPVKVLGEDSATYVRNAKTSVLDSIPPLTIDDVVLGQYGEDAEGKNESYLQDKTVPDDSRCPTFAVAHLRVRTPRWDGVPFILKAGKALDERKGEIRIQFKDAPGASFMFDNCGKADGCGSEVASHLPRNELVMKLQPTEAVYLKVNLKTPGLSFDSTQSELDLSYNKRYGDIYSPDAYTRLILEALRGNQAAFVRSDELMAAWKIFSPLLTEIDAKSKDQKEYQPIIYPYGSRGPDEAETFIRETGMARSKGYVWSPDVEK